MPLWLDQDASLRIGENPSRAQGSPVLLHPLPPIAQSPAASPPLDGVMLAMESENPGLQRKMKAA